MSTFIVGDVLNGKYEIKAVLGAGGMGTVYRARQIDLGRDVAIKVPNPQAFEVPGFLARFSREAKLVARLVHDNIVQVYEYQESDKAVYIVMEYVEGHDLKSMIMRPPSDLKVRDLAVILRATSEGLAHAHEFGIVHRDIKPHNIMVQRRPRGKWRVKIMDFGIAHLGENTNLTMQQEQLTMTGQAIGTPTYMSPEQIRGTGVTAQSDIYSLGCVSFFCFTRQTPFMGTGFTVAAAHLSDEPPKIRSRAPELPAELDNVINRCLAKDPKDRPREATDLGQEIYDSLEPIFQEPMKSIWPEPEDRRAGTDALGVTRPVGDEDPIHTVQDPGPTMADLGSKDPVNTAEFDAAGPTMGGQPGGFAGERPPEESVGRVAPEDRTVAPREETYTNPSEVSNPTIPYAGPEPAEPMEAGAVEAPPGITARKLFVILAAVLIPLLGIGITVGVLMGGGQEEGPNGDQVAQIGPVTDTEPDSTPDTDEETPLVEPSPTGPPPSPETEPSPSPDQMAATPTASPSPSPSPEPTPTADQIAQRVASMQSRFEEAGSLEDKVRTWTDTFRHPALGTAPRMRRAAQEMARQITLNPEMVPVSGDTFSMGASSGPAIAADETPQHNVTLSGYEIGMYEVTALEFSHFLNTIPDGESRNLYTPTSRTTIQLDEAGEQWIPAENQELHPANFVSWNAARRYTEWLSTQTNELYRLPTEAEWENAATDGYGTTYPWGGAQPDPSRAQYNSDSTVPVTRLREGRNDLGLYHMAGNVAEWCLDWYDENAYDEGRRVDPQGPVSPPQESRPRKVVRGGSFMTLVPEDLRVTRRDRVEPDKREADIGFRLAKDI